VVSVAEFYEGTVKASGKLIGTGSWTPPSSGRPVWVN
jgi:hypothetical protein